MNFELKPVLKITTMWNLDSVVIPVVVMVDDRKVKSFDHHLKLLHQRPHPTLELKLRFKSLTM